MDNTIFLIGRDPESIQDNAVSWHHQSNSGHLCLTGTESTPEFFILSLS